MSRRRPGISAGHSGVSWAAKRMNVAAVEPHELAAPAVVERVKHPAIPSPSFKCFRVIRRFLIGESDVDSIEDIGAFRQATPALVMLQKEEHRAQVLDLRGKVIGDNLRKMERR